MARTLHRHRANTRLRRLTGALCGVAALCALALALLPAAPASAATVPAGMFGMNDWATPSEGTFANTQSAGVHRWRVPLFWYDVERSPGERDWSKYDGIVGSAARQHTSLLMVDVGCPHWACANVGDGPTGATAQARYRAYIGDVVRRYGSQGTFWNEHPELPRTPVTDWQVRNEVNSREFWQPGPNVAAYAAFLRGASGAIHGADSSATVVMAGLTEYGQVPVATFLRQLYAQPGFRQSFDVLGVHAYAGNEVAAAGILDRVHQVAAQNGDAGKRMWITEMGWGTYGDINASRQADLLRRSYDMMIGCRSRWNLDRSYWFAYRDSRPSAGQADFAGYHTGLYDLAGRPKPAWATIQGFRDGASLPAARGASCRIGGGPQTRIKTRRRFHGTRRARMRFRASRRGSHFECRLIKARSGHARKSRAARLSRRWRKCKGHYRTRKLRPGRYHLEVRAVDRAGNADRTPARARIRLKRSRRVTVSVRVLRGHVKHVKASKKHRR